MAKHGKTSKIIEPGIGKTWQNMAKQVKMLHPELIKSDNNYIYRQLRTGNALVLWKIPVAIK
jgi:hypothetical protein